MLTNDEYYELIDLDSDFRELKLLQAHVDFWEFCLYMDYGFYELREEVLKPIAKDMQRLVKPMPPETELDILNVSLPPRTGKSYICTLFCAWCFGNYPTESIMRNTVTAKLYFKFSSDLKSIISGEANNGRYSNVFPNIKMATSGLEGWRLTQSKQGISYYGAGIEGSIIGFGASLLSILDDSVKDEFDALNINSLDKKWGWYGSAADSREEKTCKKLFIGTRWSKYDIVGRLKELGYFSNDNAKEIVVPAFVNGESYCENIHTTEKLTRTKRITSDIIWEAEWMQNPIEAKGLLFPSSELQFFKLSDLENIHGRTTIVAAADLADEGTDSMCMPIGYVYGDIVYIVDVLFTKDKVEITEPLTAAMLDKYKPRKCVMESNNGGKQFARNIKRLKSGPTSITWKQTVKNKETRILMSSGYIKEHFRFREDVEEGTQYYNFMTEFMQYSKESKNKHDDAADGTTMLAEMFNNNTEFSIRSLN